MTDLEIIKLLKEEIAQHLKSIGSEDSVKLKYERDDNGNVILLDIQNNNLTEIPQNVLKLRHLNTLRICCNDITKLTPLLQLENLKDLWISEVNFDEKDFTNFVTNAKNLKLLMYFSRYPWDIIPKNILNHNLNLTTIEFPKDFKTQFILETSKFFPPNQMIELGYRNSKFYYNVYSHIEKKYFEEFYKILNSPKNLGSDLYELQTKIISELLEINYSNYQKIENLPYAIRKLSIYNFHEIEELLIDNIASNSNSNKLNDPQWIFITGENGYGKTLLLQAITIGLNGNKEGNQILTPELAYFYLEFKNNTQSIINSIGYFQNNFTPFPHFVAYGPARLVKRPGYEKDSKTASLFKSYSELIDIEERLIAWEKDDLQVKYYKSAKNILLKLLSPQIKDIITIREGTETYVRYIEQDSEYQKSFDELASGYRSIITMVGDIIVRLSKSQQEVSDFTQLAGIVLIDEIDLHLHPKWQKAMVENLTELFSKVQFIASTHSPIPMLGAPANSVIINVQRNENGITAEKLDIDFTRLLPNSILSSPIFNFDEIVAKSKPKNKFPHTEDDYNEIIEKEKLQKKVSDFFGDNADELLNLLNSEDDEEDK